MSLPYNYSESFEKISRTFPAYGDAWRDSLSGKINISEPDYEKAKEILTLMRCNNFGDYHDFYLILDAHLLADIFKAFRGFCLKKEHLDPVLFFQLQTWVGKECWIQLKLNLVSWVILTSCYFVSEPFVVESMKSMLWSTSKPAKSTWKASIKLNNLSLGLSLMSHHYMPAQFNSLSHVAIIDGKTIWPSMTFWRQTASVAWGTSLQLI